MITSQGYIRQIITRHYTYQVLTPPLPPQRDIEATCMMISSLQLLISMTMLFLQMQTMENWTPGDMDIMHNHIAWLITFMTTFMRYCQTHYLH